MSQVRELTCIVCPASCTLKVTQTDGNVVVEGASCPRGVEFARREVLSPSRYVMSVVKVRGGDLPVVSVITSKPVPKECIWLVMSKLSSLELEAPIELGQVVLNNICGSDVKATRRVKRVVQNYQNRSVQGEQQ